MFSPSWLVMASLTLILTHFLIILVTVYFHRALSHRAINLHPVILKIFRFTSWFLMGMDPLEFAAIHRKHHALCDTQEDPHSPIRYGWTTVLFKGLKLYRKEAENKNTIEKYGKGLPQDSWEGFYQKHKSLGLFLQGILWTALFGLKGTLMWSVILIWIPFWAAGVVNGLGHHFGYRRFPTDDHSTNLFPLGIWIGGEELHNNHHARPSSPKFSAAWYEFDLGWFYIKTLMAFNLATLRAPLPQDAPLLKKILIKDISPESVLLADRYHWMRTLYQAFDREAKEKLKELGFSKWKRFAKKSHPAKKVSLKMKKALQDPLILKLHLLEESFRQIWIQRLRPNELKEKLNDWLEEAHKVGPHLSEWCDKWSYKGLAV